MNARTRSAPLWAILLSTVLLFSSIASAHVHDDGLLHYKDCESCLHLQVHSSPLSAAPSLPPLSIAKAVAGTRPHFSPERRQHLFLARAPPTSLSAPR